MAAFAARMDTAQRVMDGLKREKRERVRRELKRMDALTMNEKRREFLRRYYLRGESKKKLERELKVSRWSIRRWMAAEEGRAKKG